MLQKQGPRPPTFAANLVTFTQNLKTHGVCVGFRDASAFISLVYVDFIEPLRMTFVIFGAIGRVLGRKSLASNFTGGSELAANEHRYTRMKPAASIGAYLRTFLSAIRDSIRSRGPISSRKIVETTRVFAADEHE